MYASNLKRQRLLTKYRARITNENNTFKKYSIQLYYLSTKLTGYLLSTAIKLSHINLHTK